MNNKGISLLAVCLFAAIPASAVEERITLLPGATNAPTKAVGEWAVDGAVLRRGFKNGMEYAIADGAYKSDPTVDLLVHFDSQPVSDETGNWTPSTGHSFSIEKTKSLLGGGSGSFRGPDSALSLHPKPGSLFGNPGGRGSSFRDFSIEFWLFPANTDNGEVVLLWRSLRKLTSGVLPQQLSCVVSGGRLAWSFAGFFGRPGGAKVADADSRLELRGRSPLVPQAWSHHLLRFDGDTGLVEYLVDGRPEATAYATATGREGGTVFEPAVGSASPLEFCPEFSGLADELRISRRFVEEPSLRPFGRDPSLVVSPVADFGYGNSRFVAMEAECRVPGNSSIEFAYRIADSWAGWRADSPTWIPLRVGDVLPETARGRYVQVKAELFADGTGRLSPSLSSITLRFVPDPPPPPPARIMAVPKNGSIELHWTKVPEADLAGYLVYYGERPGEYFGTGADQGPSPIDAGDTTTLTITGIPNGRLLYFVVAAYDAAPDPDARITGATRDRAASRAGEFSPETSARPSRTAR